MAAIHLLSRAELEHRLSPYKCRFLANGRSGLEQWVTGWGVPFSLFAVSGTYDEWQYREVLRVVSDTMPQDWKA